jgi:nitroreductase/dihydropteridine reductase
VRHVLSLELVKMHTIIVMAAAEFEVGVPSMEGFYAPALDADFGLRECGFTSTMLPALGKRSSYDYVLGKPKSRYPLEK